MEISRKLWKVGKLGDENHNMTSIVHTLTPDQQNNYCIQVINTLNEFMCYPVAHSNHHTKI